MPLGSPSPLRGGVWGGGRRSKSMANERARRLRSNLTDTEKKLWWRLRMLKREGFHFRRQVPIDHFDFACYSARLVVEVDGGQHTWDEDARRDRARDAHLRSQGFRVLRFWNNDVLSNTDGVEEVIRDALTRAAPTPNPSPQGGGASEGHRLAQNSTK
jgi:very-short-patch-repair endonuclease